MDKPAHATNFSNSPTARPKVSNRVIEGAGGRILCVADIRGQFSHLNTLAVEAGAVAVIHTGDFGFFEPSSTKRISDRTLRHLLQYTPLITAEQRASLAPLESPTSVLREKLGQFVDFPLSEFPLLLSGKLQLQVPVYTVWGACEDVDILEKLRTNEYDVENLQVLDEATSRTLEIGGIKLRLLGLGGAFVPHRLFDNGEGHATIAGGNGTMWITALQMGELVDTAQRNYDPSETRILVTHASPGRESILAQLALVLKADFTISGGLHFRYGSSYNEFSVHGDPEVYKAKLLHGKEAFNKIWESVKTQVEAVIDDHQRLLLEKAILVSERMISGTNNANEELAWKNCWNWNLCDAAFGHLNLDIADGRVSGVLQSQGFNFAYRRIQQQPNPQISSPILRQTSLGLEDAGDLAQVRVATTTRQISQTNTNAKLENPRSDAIVAGDDLKGGVTVPIVASIAGQDGSALVDTDLRDRIVQGSSGASTPVSNHPAKTPWALRVKHLPIPVTESELRHFFGEAARGIKDIKFTWHHLTRQQMPLAFVEFIDEESMQAGLAKHEECINGTSVAVLVAESSDEEFTSDGQEGPGSNRGKPTLPKGRGRGSTSLLAQRAFGQAAANGQVMGRGAPKQDILSDGGKRRGPNRKGGNDSA